MNESIFTHVPYLGMSAVFNSAQNDSTSHSRLRKELVELHKTNSTADFIMEFLQCLSCCFNIQEKHNFVERALDFASVFLAQHYQHMEEVLAAVFEFIFKNHSCKSQAVRFRICEFMNRLLQSMDDQAGLYDDIFERIASTMLERLQDKVPSIRAQAVMALQRLQNPQDQSCPIIKAFIFHMERDPSSFVRAKAVKHIAITPRTFPIIFDRINDATSNVRKEAYRTLSRVRAVKLSIKQRQKLCTTGVADKSDVVRNYVLNNLMVTWFKQCNCDYLTLLKSLFVETIDPDVLETILFQLFKKQPSTSLMEMITSFLSKDKLLPLDKITQENVTLWLYGVKYFSRNTDEIDPDIVQNMLPELTHFAKYLKDFGLTLSKNNPEKEFIAIQLFKIASTYSFDDEMGREQMRMMCINYLVDENISKTPVPAIVKVFALLVPSVKDRLKMMAELISDIREPLMPSQPSQNSAEDELEGVETQLAQLSCTSLDSERNLKNDPDTLIKCLTIIIEFFKAKDVTKIDSTLLSLKDHVVSECFESQYLEVQCLAQDVMAFFCIWSLEIAKENFLKFCFQLHDSKTCLSALEGIVDILLVHGFQPFSVQNLNKEQRNKSASSIDDLSADPTLDPSQVFIVTLLMNLLENEDPKVRARACQGLAKLLLAGHLNSPLVLAKLILIWFNPLSASEPEIRQPLGIFLKVFSMKRKDAGQVIVNCILPALKAAQEMPSDEDEEVNALSVAKLLVSILRNDVCLPPDNLKQEGSYYLRLATKLCRELLIVNGCDPILIAKILQMIELQPEDGKCSAHLHLLVCRGIKKMGKFWDKKVLKTMQALKIKLEDMKENAGPDDAAVKNTEKSPDVQETSAVSSISRDSSLSSSRNISKSYSNMRSCGLQSIDETAEISPAPSPINAESSKNMVINETMDDICELSAIVNENAPNVIEETIQDGNNIETASDKEMTSTDNGVIPDSDSSCDEEMAPSLPAPPTEVVPSTEDEASKSDSSLETPKVHTAKKEKEKRKKPSATPQTKVRSLRSTSSTSSSFSPRQTRSCKKRKAT